MQCFRSWFACPCLRAHDYWRSVVDLTRSIIAFCQYESCGKCFPCRTGMSHILEILERICVGEGNMQDIETMRSVGTNMQAGSLCGHGQLGFNPVSSALQYFGAGTGGIFMGWCLDRRGMEIPALTGAIMIGLGTILTSMVTTQWELYLIYGVMLGFFGRSTLFAPLTANITRWFEHNKSLAVGVVGSGQGLAGMVWPQTFHYLINAYGWRQTALIYGVFSLVTMLPLALILKQKPPKTVSSNSSENIILS